MPDFYLLREESTGLYLLGGLSGFAMVAALEDRTERLKSLCGEMVATLLMSQNEATVPEELRKVAEGWQRRYRKIVPNPTGSGTDES